jgi:hypothetical protein
VPISARIPATVLTSDFGPPKTEVSLDNAARLWFNGPWGAQLRPTNGALKMEDFKDIEEWKRVAREIHDGITNPTLSPVQRREATEINFLAVEMTAKQFGKTIQDTWEIIKRFENDPETPMEQPDKFHSEDEKIFWHFVEEWNTVVY